MNLVILAVISALISLGAAVSGTPRHPATTGAVGSFAPLPTPTPTPAPAPYDVLTGGGPT